MNETVKTRTINTSAAEKKNKKKKMKMKKKKKRFKEMNELKERTWEHRRITRMRRIKESDALVQEVP